MPDLPTELARPCHLNPTGPQRRNCGHAAALKDHAPQPDICRVDLPRVRRYRKGAIDRLYVEDAEGLTYGWADTATGEIEIQIPGSEARVEAAFNAWANSYPEDDLALHPPGRSTQHLAAAWEAEIEALKEDRRTLEDMLAEAVYQHDQYAKGHNGELRIGVRLNALYERGWASCMRYLCMTVVPTSITYSLAAVASGR